MQHDKEHRLLHFTEKEQALLGGISSPQLDIYAAYCYALVATMATEAARDLSHAFSSEIFDWDHEATVNALSVESTALESLKIQLAAARDFVMEQPPHVPKNN